MAFVKAMLYRAATSGLVWVNAAGALGAYLVVVWDLPVLRWTLNGAMWVLIAFPFLTGAAAFLLVVLEFIDFASIHFFGVSPLGAVARVFRSLPIEPAARALHSLVAVFPAGDVEPALAESSTDLDLSSSTDLEDGAVFLLDALELLAQDLGLLLDLLGDNLTALGVAAGALFLGTRVARLVSARRAKRK